MDCCGPPDPNGLNALFRGRYVRYEARRFLRRGLDERQAFMLDRLAPRDARVLDLGAGIGPLGLSALRRGAASSVLVEVSRESLDAARDVAVQLGVAGRAAFIESDAANLEPGIEGDAVVLDRVVCCYPDGAALLRRAAAASGRVLVFSHPVSAPWLRLGRRIVNAGMRLFGRDYRFFLHDADALLAAARSDGHRLDEERRFGTWRVAVLTRETAQSRPRAAPGQPPSR